jgi:hypothetical protein
MVSSATVVALPRVSGCRAARAPTKVRTQTHLSVRLESGFTWLALTQPIAAVVHHENVAGKGVVHRVRIGQPETNVCHGSKRKDRDGVTGGT